VSWDGDAHVDGATIREVTRINAFNPTHALTWDETSLRWRAITTGNFGGFDLVCDETPGAHLSVRTKHATLDADLATLDHVRVDAGGLGMALSARRLADDAPLTLDWTAEVSRVQGDTAIGVRVLLEDGHVAWSSPIYVVPNA
jgi:hypothetical protein